MERLTLRSRVLLVINLLLILALSCSLPGVLQGTPAPDSIGAATQTSSSISNASTPSPTPAPLPPALVESNPPPGSEIPLQGPITLFFNQPMDRVSVEGAISGEPTLSGRFQWVEDYVLSFTPDQPFLPETSLTLTVGSSARSQKGLALINPISLEYRTTGYLKLSQQLPEPDAVEVDPTSAVVAAFNRPVVSLGENQSAPAPFTLEPETQGRGEWINTSTYIFYPEPALVGGADYTVSIAPDLTGVDGSPLDNSAEAGASELSWSFRTVEPQIAAVIVPDDGLRVRLDPTIEIHFNQPMDRESVESMFSLRDVRGQDVEGSFTWAEDSTWFGFKPDSLLQRDQEYSFMMRNGALSAGGTPLEQQSTQRFTTVPNLQLVYSDPGPGELKENFSPVVLAFSSNLDEDEIQDAFQISPRVSGFGAYLDMDRRTVNLYGNFEPDTDYVVTPSAELSDVWGDRLEETFRLSFRTRSLDPSFYLPIGSDAIFLTTADSSIAAQATNLPLVPFSVGQVPLEDFLVMLGPDGYNIRQTYSPRQMSHLQQPLELPENTSQAVAINLSEDGQPLDAGLYYLRFNFPNQQLYAGPYLLVVSDVNITFKISAEDTLVWAVDLITGEPAAGAPVAIYNEDGQLLASGETDADGVFSSGISGFEDPYQQFYAVLGQPGGGNFGMALSTWRQGIESWDFDIPSRLEAPGLKTYFYTDRPIYRPGQTVYFKVAARNSANGRYTMPDLGSLPLQAFDAHGESLAAFDIPLSAFGTGHGEIELPLDAPPGFYSINYESDSIYFQVANYRKPEINLQVSFDQEQALVDQLISAQVDARYFFDAPVPGADLSWALYVKSENFHLSGYQVGPMDDGWMSYKVSPYFESEPGTLVSRGEGRTGPDGLFTLDLPLTYEQPDAPGVEIEGQRRYTLEVTATDENGLPVSSRASVLVHPASFYIGLHSDSWVGRAGQEASFSVQVVDWNGDPVGERTLEGLFQKVEWARDDEIYDQWGLLVYEPVYTPVASTSFVTAPDGAARLSFTPPEPGVYQLRVTGEEALSEILLWVGGDGDPVWPNIPNQRLRLNTDQEIYRAGDTARVFISNPWEDGALALVTLERSRVMSYQVMEIEGAGLELPIELSAEDAPNVYLSVTLLAPKDAGKFDFRQGYVELKVEPTEQILNVEVTQLEPGQHLEPGEPVSFGLLVTDNDGNPVQGEFSVAVVDKAVLALADPNSPDILPAFYGQQRLGVNSSLSLAAYAFRQFVFPGGMGGGGGDGGLEAVARQHFPDTAYWNAVVVTDENGQAIINLTLPDSLTTWRVDVRGLTVDTRVGSTVLEVVTSKDFMIRPSTPRFLVVGDHLQLAAVVHNNTGQDLEAEVSLQASGFDLDSGQSAVQTTALASGEQARLEWWGTVQDQNSAELVFSAQAGSYQDVTTPANGALPILSYTAPQTFGTSGILDGSAGGGTERLELISLPATFEPHGGSLQVALSPSLAGTILSGLEALERFPYETNERMVSRLLPNLEAYRALQTFGIENQELEDRLSQMLDDDLRLLLSRQNPYGGWGWWTGGESDPYMTAYVLFGLSRAKENNIAISQEALDRATGYLIAALPAVEMVNEPQQLDRLAFQHFALAYAGSGDLHELGGLYEQRTMLSPWAQAMLAMALGKTSPDDPRGQTILSDLQGEALRSASGAHWEESPPEGSPAHSAVFTTAVTTYVLAQREPAAPLLADAVRYLVANRRAPGGWSSSYETAWTLMALTEFLKGTGELGGSFDFNAELNGTPLAVGAASTTISEPVTAETPLSGLRPDDPNALAIRRSEGPGRLYYSAYLNLSRPVESVVPINRGMEITRGYYPAASDCQGNCAALEQAQVGDNVWVRLTLTLPHETYNLVIEDSLPAGAEIRDPNVKTSALGDPMSPDIVEPQTEFDSSDPFREGWGWWFFAEPQVYDDHILWTADYLPAGTYQLVYPLTLLQPGEFRVLPAHAWEFYFPDVEGTSAGEVFTIIER